MVRAALPYFGSTLLWSQAIAAGGFSFRQNERYQRRSQRNRMRILNSHGPQLLSIPLLGGRSQPDSIREVRISYKEDWPRQHWLSIVAAYGSAPYWLTYKDELEDFYQQTPELLWDWNWRCVAWMQEQIAPSLVLAKADDWQPAVDRLEPSMLPDDRLPSYPQLFSERTGWVSNVSILDLLMCQGPAARGYLSLSTD